MCIETAPEEAHQSLATLLLTPGQLSVASALPPSLLGCAAVARLRLAHSAFVHLLEHPSFLMLSIRDFVPGQFHCPFCSLEAHHRSPTSRR